MKEKSKTLSDLPRELIFLIADKLNVESASHLAQTSSFFKKEMWPEFKKKFFEETFHNIVFKLLNSLNPHDLYYLAKKNGLIALIVVQTPFLAKKLNQSLVKDMLISAKEIEKYKPQNCLYKDKERYDYEILAPLVGIAKKYPKVAEVLLNKNYKATKLTEDTKVEIQEILLNAKSSNPSI